MLVVDQLKSHNVEMKETSPFIKVMNDNTCEGLAVLDAFDSFTKHGMKADLTSVHARALTREVLFHSHNRDWKYFFMTLVRSNPPAKRVTVTLLPEPQAQSFSEKYTIQNVVLLFEAEASDASASDLKNFMVAFREAYAISASFITEQVGVELDHIAVQTIDPEHETCERLDAATTFFSKPNADNQSKLCNTFTNFPSGSVILLKAQGIVEARKQDGSLLKDVLLLLARIKDTPMPTDDACTSAKGVIQLPDAAKWKGIATDYVEVKSKLSAEFLCGSHSGKLRVIESRFTEVITIVKRLMDCSFLHKVGEMLEVLTSLCYKTNKFLGAPLGGSVAS